MLPPFIIEQIRKREQEQKHDGQAEQPTIELPTEHVRPPTDPPHDDDPGRGVVILDL